MRVLRLLAQAIELNLLDGRGLHADELRANLGQLLFALERKQAEGLVMRNAGEARSSLQHYFRHLGASVESLAHDLSSSIQALEQTLQELHGEEAQRWTRLEEVSARFAEQRSFDDVRVLHKHFEECLGELREEIRQQKLCTLRNGAKMGEAIGKLRQVAQDAAGEPRLVFAALHVRSLGPVRDRFGEGMAVEMKDYLRRALLARWPSGKIAEDGRADVLLLLDREDLDVAKHRSAMKRFSAERLVYSTTHEEREYLLPIHFDWIVAAAHNEMQARTQVQLFLNSPANAELN